MKKLKILLLVSTVILFTACGGGSSSSDGTINETPQTIAIDKIEAHADDNTQPIPTVVDYANAGVVGVTSENLDDINEIVAGLTSSDVDTIEEIQKITDGLNINILPTANAGIDKSAEVDQSVSIIGSASDSDGTIVSYEWTKGTTVLAATALFDYTPTTVGTDTLTLTVMDDDGDTASDSMNVTVTVTPVPDTTPPVITVLGTNPETLTQGDTYTDTGATALDDKDGTIPVTTTGTVDASTVGTYTITYTATDDASNTATATRTVTVSATLEPAVPSSALTQELMDSITHMYSEERLAYDVYMNIYKIQAVNQLQNIAINSETKHIDAVNKLAINYDLNITKYPDTNHPYSTDDLDRYGSGEYPVEPIQELYNLLYDKGIQSKKDALEVGCMVEVADIEDLDSYIAQAQVSNAEDVLDTFNFLRNGSYSHYWTFDGGLKNMGITEGCCSLEPALGYDFCHPEYPTK